MAFSSTATETQILGDTKPRQRRVGTPDSNSDSSLIMPESEFAPVADDRFPDIAAIRAAIPAHCFEPPLARSLGYLARDFALCLSLGYAALTYIPQLESAPLRWAAWALYGWLQGLVCVGIWILAHECGHGAFSRHQRVNDCIGWAAHSFLMVPYFSWKFSHHRHHRFTGHMEKDMAFVPRTRDDYYQPRASSLWLDPELFEDTPLVQAGKLIGHQLLGWQMYLLLNATSGPDSMQKKTGWLRQSHFEPTSAVFRPNEALFIALSDLGLAITGMGLYWLSTVVGWSTVGLLYAVPYFWVHHWLVAITYLHHNHPDVHHYDADSWTFVKGALATIDRDFGFIGRHLFHGIIECHVVHHLFPRIPFYYADEATEAIKPVVGDLYKRDPRPFLGQLWSVFTTCKYVESDPDVPGAMRPIEDRTYQVWSNVHRDMKAGYTYFFVSAPPWEFDASRHDWLYQWLRPLIDLMGSPHVYLLVVEVFHEQCGRELRLVADGRYWDAYVNHLEFAAHLEDADLDVPTRVHEHAIWTWPDLEVGRRGIHHEFIKAVKTEPTITPFMLAASVRWQHKHPRFNGKNEASPAAYIEFILEEGLR
ncbi:hypothetical protein P8C59_005727 [Phyllachora maydis]|uniref:Fatty acid desaturase domain-containing protein n=1 Tax=Phyllachora maydis TaxID=1825666 RepID=A0AAD9I5A8_9PEZI|nr:hypothetical protein P8C59_005727 [Phyllachora maydis]